MTGKRRSNYMGDRTDFHLKIPVELHQRLAIECEKRDVSATKMIEKALTLYLDKLKPLDEVL